MRCAVANVRGTWCADVLVVSHINPSPPKENAHCCCVESVVTKVTNQVSRVMRGMLVHLVPTAAELPTVGGKGSASEAVVCQSNVTTL